MNETVTIKNVGPIERAEIPLDPEGGVTVLRGFNGCGKDHAIEAVARAIGGKHSPPCSDGAAKGLIEGLGVRVSLGKVSRRSGECVAASLTGKFDLSEFVEPREKDPEAADRKRIKALLAIRGVGPNHHLFYDLAKDSTLSNRAIGASDLVEQARIIKADWEAEARKLADRAQREEGHAAACRESAEGVDLSGESDGDKLQGALEAALREESALEARQDAAEKAAEAADYAQAELEKAKATYTGPTLAQAKALVSEASERHSQQSARVDALRHELEEAESVLKSIYSEGIRAQDKRNAAEDHEGAMVGWQSTINADRPEPVRAGAFSAASEAVTEARAGIEQGVLIREAREAKARADQFAGLARQLRADADRLREAAKATDTVLSDAVASDTLWVEDGRLIAKHARRAGGKCLVHDLSKGECWRVAVPEAVKRIREINAEGLALIPIPQHAYEGLDPEGRADLYRLAKEHRVNFVTAEAADGELRADIYETPGG